MRQKYMFEKALLHSQRNQNYYLFRLHQIAGSREEIFLIWWVECVIQITQVIQIVEEKLLTL